MERNRLARQIIDTCTEMTRLGLNQGTAGNVSVRYQGGMLITPTGIPYEKLTEDKIVFIDADGQHEQENCPPANGVFIRRPTRRDPMPGGGPQSRCPLYGGVDPQPAHPGHSLYDRRGRREFDPLRALCHLRHPRTV